jgi:NADPH-dependent 2,4-dienoyl-CoA reductase/sulfur reductase-like enzyme/rhodanese-related sulfurtransferase
MTKKLLIIGGGAGGPTAAARARRLSENDEIILFEQGEHISYAHCGLPYFIGGVITDRSLLTVSNPDRFRQRYRVEARILSKVKEIVPATKQIEVIDGTTGKNYRERYDILLLSTGASPVRPPIPGIDGEDIFVLRNLTDADNILKFIMEKEPEKAVVVGGGYIGLEIAENLKHRGIEVTLVEMLDHILAPLDAEMAEKVQHTLESNSIELVLSSAVNAFIKRNGRTIVELQSGREIGCDMVMLCAGTRPNIELAQSAGLEIGERGGISVNEYMQTSNPHIYAVGDAVETRCKVTGQKLLVQLAGLANRQARLAVDNMYGRKVVYRNTLGTSIIRLFDTTAAATGPNEKTLRRLDIPYGKCYLHPYSHSNYYPGSSQMVIKVIFSTSTGRILGAQIVGGEGVDKRIDIFATAITAGMTADDLTHLELSYVPQYGSAKDAVNMSGYVASNIISGDAPTVHWDEINSTDHERHLLLDVRRQDEFEAGAVPDAKLLPIDELRNRHRELPRDIPIHLYCETGIRSYVATRLLQQKGFDAKNVSGGILLQRP